MTYAVYYQWRGRPGAGWHLYQRWPYCTGECERPSCDRLPIDMQRHAEQTAAELRAVGIAAEVREERG